MLTKLLLTLAVILAAYYVLRARPSGKRTGVARGEQVPVLPRGVIRPLAYALLGVMLGGSAFWLYRDWVHGRVVVQVEVVNTNTGGVTTYRAHRADIDGRRLRTVDGKVVTLAEVERMVVSAAD